VKAEELRALELADLRAKVEVLQEELFKVKFQHATSQLSDTSKVRKSRRDLARAQTILAELQGTASAGQEG
jgi:large subunit ribosomal protein L29